MTYVAVLIVGGIVAICVAAILGNFLMSMMDDDAEE